MATYAIGDVQGCYEELRRLLDQIDFDDQRDTLWFAGDLVNRGPHSLETLRFVRELGNSAFTVLGNHDLHLLAAVNGNKRSQKEKALQGVLKAKDRDELAAWLQTRPLLHQDKKLDFAMVHAGLPPQWTLKQAIGYAQEVEQILRGKEAKSYFRAMYGNEPDFWQDDLQGMGRYRFITNCLTRLRYCEYDGRLALSVRGEPGRHPPGLLPWFRVPGRRTSNDRLICGHWSTLGYVEENNVWAIDTGCLWGGHLTALRLDGGRPRPIHYDCPGVLKPGEAGD
jgi:bis(5'-nucleosyl)-tetraphosphatase (symmetrical)